MPGNLVRSLTLSLLPCTVAAVDVFVDGVGFFAFWFGGLMFCTLLVIGVVVCRCYGLLVCVLFA